MVVDEELKMMSDVCPDGGRIRGPYLKRMSRLTHTEYVLEGRTTLDPREVLRRTMFAPTVTGSPMGNACTVIARHETTPRGYYAGVLARFTPDGKSLVVLRGEISHKDLWTIELETGRERQLSRFASDFLAHDFDISPDGRDIVVEQLREHSDVVLIERPRR